MISFAKSESGEPLERKIIVFKDGVRDEEKDLVVNKVKGLKIKDLKMINGSSVLIAAKGLDVLKSEHNVLRVDDDALASIMGKNSEKTGQALPWGVDSIDAEKVFPFVSAGSIKVCAIDTGVDTSHPDLKGNIKGGYNAINPKNSFKDDNGHGTHVAGIIAAVDNSIGVVGVAPQADIYAVKALNSNGTGYVSDIIEGLDWAVNNKMDVVNMSFGVSTDNQSLHDAISIAYEAGIVLVAASGNNPESTVAYPAAYPEVISVTALDSNNNIAPFASRGKVDIAAPGVDIYSTYKGSTYKSLSGTSMAAPHVAGVAALLLSVPSKCDTDSNGICTPEEVRKRLEITSIDLGAPGMDSIYGSGLVNAYNAVTR